MRLLVQPNDGAQPLVRAIAHAKHNIDILIFRFDHREIERALANAVSRGVAVHALIANTNRSGEDGLRKLELRLLAAGVTVARTDDDLARYHGKLMIVDRHELYLMAFNPTYSDIEHSRSFAVVTKRPVVVREAARLFEADAARHPYEPGVEALVVSPVNARRLLAEFVAGAKKELVIYDPKVSDLEMVRLLEQRAAAGVQIRLIGRLTRNIPGIEVAKLPMRIHTRTMVRDGRLAFVGSQSLRAVELDARREVGLIFQERKAVAALHQTFTADWALAQRAGNHLNTDEPVSKVAKKVAKFLAKEMPQVAPVLNGAVKEIVGDGAQVNLDPQEVEEALKSAVKSAVKEVVSDMVEEAVVEEARAR
ncbi:MAG TPA: phospholipase D-like domain-containing protein [Bryobacteraceae bacterium]|nr:phospholipase D-like domain-containing protein [Bryobacteraceae bacterium]